MTPVLHVQVKTYVHLLVCFEKMLVLTYFGSHNAAEGHLMLCSKKEFF